MYSLITTNRFDKDSVRCAKRGLKLELLGKATN